MGHNTILVVVLLRLLIIAERSEANNHDLWASESQLALIYMYMDAIFEFVAQKEAEIWTSLYCIVLSSKSYYSSQGS